MRSRAFFDPETKRKDHRQTVFFHRRFQKYADGSRGPSFLAQRHALPRCDWNSCAFSPAAPRSRSSRTTMSAACPRKIGALKLVEPLRELFQGTGGAPLWGMKLGPAGQFHRPPPLWPGPGLAIGFRARSPAKSWKSCARPTRSISTRSAKHGALRRDLAGLSSRSCRCAPWA